MSHLQLKSKFFLKKLSAKENHISLGLFKVLESDPIPIDDLIFAFT